MSINSFSHYYRWIKSKVSHVLSSKNYLCRIEEIDLTKNIIIIHCKWIESPIKLTLDEVINDTDLLSNFSPKHASWIGFYYGKYYNKLISQNRYSTASLQFNHDESINKFNIQSVTRHGYLIYIDNETNTHHSMHPVTIMATNHLINKFNPLQACYIGILSGISKAKLSARAISNPSNANLKLVK